MAANTAATPAFIYDNVTSNPTIQNPSTSQTCDAVTNVYLAGANSLAFTLAATSNSPVWISCVDYIGAAARTGTTIVANGLTYTLGTSSCTAVCVRIGPASANKWMILGAQTAS